MRAVVLMCTFVALAQSASLTKDLEALKKLMENIGAKNKPGAASRNYMRADQTVKGRKHQDSERNTVYPDRRRSNTDDTLNSAKDSVRNTVYPDRRSNTDDTLNSAKDSVRNTVYPDRRSNTDETLNSAKDSVRNTVYPDRRSNTDETLNIAKDSVRNTVYPDRRSNTDDTLNSAKDSVRNTVYPDRRSNTDDTLNSAKDSVRNTVYPDRRRSNTDDTLNSAKDSVRNTVYPDRRSNTDDTLNSAKDSVRNTVYPDRKMNDNENTVFSHERMNHNKKLDSKSGTSGPNVLFILADDLGWNDIGYKNGDVLTPNLDQLAADGVILNHNYVQPVCTPSRHSLMSGRYPHKSLMNHGVLGDDVPHCSPTNIKFLPERFQDLGYTTFGVGKWHLGFCQAACLPTSRGFDKFYGCYTGAEGFYSHRTGSKQGYDWRNGTEIDWSVDSQYHTYIVNNYVVDALNNHDRDTPFFMYLSYTNVHTPLEVPSKYYDMYSHIPQEGRRTYLAMATVMDESIGNIVQTLKDNNMYDDTIIVFSSDNGGEAGGNADNSPLRGGKGSVYEGGTRVVGFVNSPLLTRRNYVHEGLFHIVDWTKTLMSMVGGPIDDELDGYDQSDMILNGESSKRREIIYNLDMETAPVFGQSAIRIDDYKLIWGNSGYTDGRGLDQTLFYQDPQNLALLNMTKDATLRNSNTVIGTINQKGGVSFSQQDIMIMMQLYSVLCWNINDEDSGVVELYDLSVDPNEYTNLAGNQDFADVVLNLKNHILELYDEYVKPPAYTNEHWVAQSDPTNFGDTWSSGWCENIQILL